MPQAAQLLGWQLHAVDPDAGTIEVGFELDGRFTNPMGHVQGGFVSAMLDDTLGPALVATLPADCFAPTVSLHVQFLSAAHPGRFVGTGRVVRKGKSIAFLSGELHSSTGVLVATADATAVIRTVTP